MNHTPLPQTADVSRRSFLTTSGGLALGSAVLAGFPSSLTSAESSQKLRVGLIGCGGRGTGAAKQALSADPNVVLTAVGDAFEDRLKTSLNALKADSKIGSQVQVQSDHCFLGLDAYQKVIASDVDVVLLTTPPGFRPLHIKTAIEAGKHVFAEKPMAVDGPGVRSVLASAAEAKKRNLALGAGFCWRYNLAERAGFEQIHQGAIGDVRTIYGTYNTGSLWSKPRQPEWSDMEWQLRNWLYLTWLSGDHLVEQAAHAVDWMCWAMKSEPPAKCVGTGGRQVRTDAAYGHIYDHFAVTYEWANGSRGFIFCRQQANCANDNSLTVYGSKGVARILGFGGMPSIKGDTEWRYRGPRPDMYQVEHNELFASIRAGKPINDGVWMAHSTLTAIMGRMAAYTGKEITWEKALNSQESLMPEKVALNASLPVPPIAIPGITPFS
ncbi:MAG: Gfo/Idh/MocA family oxidoreductase [Verrucomicrobiota bacterium]